MPCLHHLNMDYILGVSVLGGPLSVLQVAWSAPKFKLTSYYSVHPLILSATHILFCTVSPGHPGHPSVKVQSQSHVGVPEVAVLRGSRALQVLKTLESSCCWCKWVIQVIPWSTTHRQLMYMTKKTIPRLNRLKVLLNLALRQPGCWSTAHGNKICTNVSFNVFFSDFRFLPGCFSLFLMSFFRKRKTKI